MPKGINKDGSPKTRPVGAGRKPKPNKQKNFKLALDVLQVLNKKKNETRYLEELIRKDAGLPEPEE